MFLERQKDLEQTWCGEALAAMVHQVCSIISGVPQSQKERLNDEVNPTADEFEHMEVD